MKKFIAFVLCVVLIFSLTVCSFGATPTNTSGSVTVTNWPQWFTGAHDASIASDLMFVRAHCANIAGYLELIEPDINDLNANVALIPGAISVSNGLITDIKILFNNFYTAFENIILNNYDDYHIETIGAIGGVTSAVNSVRSAVSNFNQDFTYSTDINNKYSLGYSLYMLQQVLADDDDLAMKNKNKQQSNQALEFAETGLQVGGKTLSYFDTVTHGLQGIGFFNQFFNVSYNFSNSINNLAGGFRSSEAWSWFTEDNKNDINGSSVSSLSFAPESEIVTSYYQENLNNLNLVLGGD